MYKIKNITKDVLKIYEKGQEVLVQPNHSVVVSEKPEKKYINTHFKVVKLEDE